MESFKKTADTGKVSRELWTLHHRYLADLREGSPTDEEAESKRWVLIDVLAIKSAAVLLTDLEALGMQTTGHFGRMVSGRFPLDRVPQLSRLSSLKFARSLLAQTHPGSLPRSVPGSVPQE